MPDESPIDQLSRRLGAEWPHIREARARTADVMRRLEVLSEWASEDAAIVAYGSIGRGEFTEDSDADWTLLIDGPSDPEHAHLVAKIGKKLVDLGLRKPGPTETFGVMASSHDLVHHIAGNHDTNENLTRRILMLFESTALTSPLVRSRVIANVIDRYVTFDVVAPRKSPPEQVIPHFLLNDVVRYWRTMATDYASKMWERQNDGWGLRNIKLRFSRKLIFIAGLLACFSFVLDPPEDAKRIREDRENLPAALAQFIKSRLDRTPLESIASTLLQLELDAIAGRFFGSYDDFLAILLNKEKREELKRISLDQALESPAWEEAREASHVFRDAVEELFLKSDGTLRDLTLRYGVF